MKYMFLAILLFVSNLLKAQQDLQTSINFKGRIYTVSKDSAGNWQLPEMIKCTFLQQVQKEELGDSLVIQALNLFLKKTE